MAATQVRSLADDLRARGDEQLAALVLARPDLVHPVPADLAALALRAGSAPSVAAALLDLDQLALHVVLAAALGPDPVTPAELVRAVAAHLPAPQARDRAREVVDRLRSRGLVWGTDRCLHLVGAARDLVVPADRGPRVAALDPVVAGYSRDPGLLADVLAAAPDGARNALDRLLSGPVIGTVVDARRVPDPARSPVDWLLAHHLLLPLGTDRAVVPGEVVALLRGRRPGDPTPPPGPAAPAKLVPPAPAAGAPAVERTEAGSVGAVLDVLHGVAELGLVWAEQPPTRLRTGGIAVRDLAQAARAMGTVEPTASLLVEVAAAAGLVAPDSHVPATVLPTPAFDTWLEAAPPTRHADLVLAWRDMPRAVAGPQERPLSPGLAAPHLPALRREVLVILASADGAWTDAELLDALAWRAPRRADSARAEQAGAALDQLRGLGLLVGGTLTRAGHALVDHDRALVEEALGRCLPAQVDTVVMQADLTAIVPGLPTPGLAALMRAIAEPESTGAASVYRFSGDRIRRALDSGWTAQGLLGELGRRGPVPQPLAYLVDDLGRRHASLRIGATATYLRCDDTVLLATILADPGAAALGLYPLSETVLACDQPPERVLDRLRQLGHFPLPEPGRGPEAPGPRRARGRAIAPPPAPSPVTPALAAAAVRAMRASDRAGDPERLPAAPGGRGAGTGGPRTTAPGTAHPVPSGSPAEVVAALRAAIATEAAVWIGYADPTGVAGDRRVEPLRLAGGYLTALDLRSEQVQAFALARITGVEPT